MTIPFAPFIFSGFERTDVDVAFTDTLNLSKATAIVKMRSFSRAKTIRFSEQWNITTELRENVISYTDTLNLSKATNKVETINPSNFRAVQDVDALPSIIVDLTWDNGGVTAYTLTLDRRDTATWSTVDAAITAGVEVYQDTEATTDTNRYRITLNVTGATPVEVIIHIAT